MSSATSTEILRPIDAAKPRYAVAQDSAVETTPNLDKRRNCQGAGNIVIYEFPNSQGSYAMLCLNVFVLATCTVLLSGYTAQLQNLASELKDWVLAKVTDASDAGPQARKRALPSTWAELYHTTANNGTTVATEAELQALAPPAGQRYGSDSSAPQLSLSAAELHEDGFSASISIGGGGGLEERTVCYEQIHIHYWAANGAQSTLLDATGIYDLMYEAIGDSYHRNVAQACYETTNGGSWDGFLRICYNYNQAQAGCFTCGGHNN